MDDPTLGRTTAAESGTDIATGVVNSGDQVGAYTIAGLLGQGGMGAVYLAEQERPHRKVALKLMRPGLASAQSLRRFEHEAEVLGLLHHPGIAQIYEAGLHNGIPYFAMEHVDGQTLVQYARANKLGTRDRLELFTKVCDAVHHAHQKGVIHRDLKPGNILVTRVGEPPEAQPKILDFGVARATDSDIQTTTMRTDIGQLIGTVPYMSPEQVSGDPNELDTRSDVYALGVVLYELLAGRLPYDLKDRMIHEAARVIREDEPTRLSVSDAKLRGDIETIVAKALEKEKSRRYQSALDFGSDVRRYLSDEPIVARPASTWYQVRKFSRRNKALVGGVAATFLVLVAGIVVSAGQAVRATRAEQNATNRLAEAEEVVGFLDDMLAAADPGIMGKDVPVRAVLDESARTIDDEFNDRPAVAARLHSTVGRTYLQLGLIEEGHDHVARAHSIRDEHLGVDHADTLRAQADLGYALIVAGRFEEAEDVLNESLRSHTERLGRTNPNTVYCLTQLATLHAEQSNFEKAESYLRESLELNRKIHGDDHQDTIGTRSNLAMVLSDLSRFEEAEPLYDRALADALRVLGPDHPLTLQTQSNLAWMYFWDRRYDESIELNQHVLANKLRVLGEEHHDTMTTMNNLAVAYKATEQYDKAEPLYKRDLEISAKVLGESHPDYVTSLVNYANFLGESGRCPDALPLFEQAIATQEEVLPELHYGRGYTLGFYAKCLRSVGDFAASESNFLSAKAIMDANFEPGHGIHAAFATDISRLYEAWHEAEPGEGYDAKAAEWWAKVEAAQEPDQSGDNDSSE